MGLFNKKDETITGAIQTLDKVSKNFDEIIKLCQEREELIKRQRERINFLENEYSKDSELQKLKEELKKEKEDSRRGFPITKEEDEKISEWTMAHLKEKHWDKKNDCPKSFGAIGGNFTYNFIPTSIGIIGTVKCSCGAEFTFQEL